jgi:hypothetical protein
MGSWTIIFATTLASVALVSAATSQTACEIQCPRGPIRFAGCDISSIEHHYKDRIGIVGRAIEIGSGAYCKSRLSVDVLQASIEGTPSHMNVDYDPCLIWAAQPDAPVKIYVWQRASPNTGAYTLAPCSK